MQQNTPYLLSFYLQLRLTYSCHYIKDRKTNRIFLLRMKERFIKPFSSSDIFTGCIKNLCIVCASTEQFLNKHVFIKTVLVKSSNLQSKFLYCSGGYAFHHCTLDSRERNTKSIQHQNCNCKLDLMYPKDYV